MKLKRYEILLPLKYNDGAEIEKEKFDQTHKELLEEFGATTFDSVVAYGRWVYKGLVYEDQVLRFRVDTKSAKKSQAFFKKYKKVLKERFRQLDIWITAHDLEVI